MSHYHFLVNTRAGRGKAVQAWKVIQHTLKSEPHISFSWSDLTTTTTDSLQVPDDSALVVVGGDGSIHSAAKIALEHEKPLGIVPAGTGNDYAATMGIPRDVNAALKVVFANRIKEYDVLSLVEANDIAINAMGFGLDATVVHHIERAMWLKNIGPLAYAFILPAVLHTFKPYSARLLIDGMSVTHEHINLLAVANGPTFGGGMKVVPDAKLDDGKFEVCVASGLSNLSVLRLFPSLYKGTHIHHPSVRLYSATHLQIEFSVNNQLAEFDGEAAVAPARSTISFYPRKLRLLVPSGSQSS